jgi:hypothetical protein
MTTERKDGGPRYVRRADDDTRFEWNDDFASDAWLDTKTGLTVRTIVGFDPNADTLLAERQKGGA